MTPHPNSFQGDFKLFLLSLIAKGCAGDDVAPRPRYLRHFQIFDKIDSFPKEILIVFSVKKGKLYL